MTEWKMFQSFLDYTKSHYESMETWSDDEKLQEVVYAIEKEICRLRERRVIKVDQNDAIVERE